MHEKHGLTRPASYPFENLLIVSLETSTVRTRGRTTIKQIFASLWSGKSLPRKHNEREMMRGAEETGKTTSKNGQLLPLRDTNDNRRPTEMETDYTIL